MAQTVKSIAQKILFLPLAALLVALQACSSDAKQAAEEPQLPGAEAVLSALQQSADLVTTELTVRKMAVYDTSKSEPFRWRDPRTWKYGDQMCIVPVEVHIRYGFDLRAMRVEDIRVSADSGTVVIRLPKPKIIDAGYNTYIDEGSVVKMSTGLRSEVGHAIEEEIRRKGYEAVLAQDLTPVVGEEVTQNAQTLFTSIVKALGWKQVVVEIKEK